MKFFLILACLALYVAYIEAQSCLGEPDRHECDHPRNSGHNNERHCRNHANQRMWYYNHDRNDCLTMPYLGCGGNRNRWCTKAECDRRCHRPRRNN